MCGKIKIKKELTGELKNTKSPEKKTCWKIVMNDRRNVSKLPRSRTSSRRMNSLKQNT